MRSCVWTICGERQQEKEEKRREDREAERGRDRHRHRHRDRQRQRGERQRERMIKKDYATDDYIERSISAPPLSVYNPLEVS